MSAATLGARLRPSLLRRVRTRAGDIEVAALEARALDPERHALAWTHFLRAAVASTRSETNLGERLTGAGPGSLPPGTLSASAERGVAGDDRRLRRDADDDDADAATTEANDEGEPVLAETCTPLASQTPLTSHVVTRDAMDTPPGGGFGNAFLGDATDDVDRRGDDDRADPCGQLDVPARPERRERGTSRGPGRRRHHSAASRVTAARHRGGSALRRSVGPGGARPAGRPQRRDCEPEHGRVDGRHD